MEPLPADASDGELLIANLHWLSETAPGVARTIVRHLGTRRDALRGVSRLLRAVVNNTVTAVMWSRSLEGRADLGAAFPNATKLMLRLRDAPIHERPYVLRGLLGVAPRLVARLQAVDMQFRAGHSREQCDTTIDVTKFLSQ
jgi:hypothetical protein